MNTLTSTAVALDPNSAPSALVSLLSSLPDAARGHDYTLLAGLLLAAVVILFRAWEKQRAVPDAWAPWVTLLLASAPAAAIGLEKHYSIQTVLTASAASGLTAIGGVWAFEDLVVRTAKALWSRCKKLVAPTAIFLVAMSSAVSFAQTKTASVAAPAPVQAPASSSTTTESGVLKLVNDAIGVFNREGLTASITLNENVLGLDCKGHLLSASAGIGVGYAFKVPAGSLVKPKLSLSIAPEVAYDGVAQQGRFDAVLSATGIKGWGVGLIWRALTVGSGGGWTKPDSHSLLLGLTYDLAVGVGG